MTTAIRATTRRCAAAGAMLASAMFCLPAMAQAPAAKNLPVNGDECEETLGRDCPKGSVIDVPLADDMGLCDYRYSVAVYLYRDKPYIVCVRK